MLRQPLLAGYFFGTPEAGKYLSQFLPSHLALINHIPAHLLVGPAAPLAHAPALPYRYDGAMFSLARPQFVAPPAPAGPLGQVQALLLLGGDGAADAGAKLRARATAPLKPTRQPDNARLDFFASGVLTSLAITLSALLPLLGYTTWVVGRKGLEMAMRKIKE